MPEVERRRFRKVLIANRGEIAVRILRALRELDIRGAVIYSDADRESLAVLSADEAHRIGAPPSAESYLRMEAIVELAVEIGADAIHPGYGFLAERAELSALCRERGVVFVGPSPEAIAALGSKTEARRRMIDAGVPVVPGSAGALDDLDAAREAAARAGYPVILKASAGGGGKGMRVVRGERELGEAFRLARAEARSAFGDDAVFLEKFVVEPRHVEIQLLGDLDGKVVSLGERECSLQRRHQKVVEEAPSTAVSPELRRRMGEAAVAAARAVGYSNAGTCEFLLARSGEFYFLEMNTRLQVEHPVTEMVTGLDLVVAQLRIAQGEPLGPEFDGVEPLGHAVEVRLYAEDPYNRFAPSPGRIAWLRLPQGPGVRNDAGVYGGCEVPIDYDPMLAKLIVWGRDRAEALRRLGRALDELRVEGIRTNAPLFEALLADDEFRRGEFDIHWLDRKLAAGELVPPERGAGSDVPILAAAIEHFDRAQRTAAQPNGAPHRAAWTGAARRAALRSTRWS
ncbi:MAG TPA: acetyl-CoA carboxylase biotin carboxylase subunit [Thermoanaerobaculia bacterium]